MSTLQRRRALIRQFYGFDFPEEFYRFWEFVNRLKPLEPLLALRDDLEIVLTGPFEVLAGRFDQIEPPASLYLHWRYFQDPPEFFTVMVGGWDGNHWGYYFDDPPDGPRCVARYDLEEFMEIGTEGNTLFQAIRWWLEMGWEDEKDRYRAGRITPEELQNKKERLDHIRDTLRQFGTRNRPGAGYKYTDKYGQRSPARFRQVLEDTGDGMGIIVPPETYRPLSLAPEQLDKQLWETDDPTELVQQARQALRQGFPGTTLLAGKELWAVSKPRHQEYAAELLDAAYAALGREVLRQVLRTHVEHRYRPYLDILHREGT